MQLRRHGLRRGRQGRFRRGATVLQLHGVVLLIGATGAA